MHDGLQPVSLRQQTQQPDLDRPAGHLLTAEKPSAEVPVQLPPEVLHSPRPRVGTRPSRELAEASQPTVPTPPAVPAAPTGSIAVVEERQPELPSAPVAAPAPARSAPPVPTAAAAPAAVPTPPAPAQPLTAQDLTDERLLRSHRRAPSSGWRRMVFQASFGLVNPGESPAALRYQALVARAQAPVTGCRRIAVVSAKGGVGKTSTTLGLGATAASVRGDRVIAVDANPDLGTLGERVHRDNQATVRDLLRATGRLERYPDIRAFTSQTASRLEVLAADRDPALSEAFDEADYRHACDLLGRFYNLIVTDCGTGLLHSAMAGVLGVADQIVLVAAPAVDGARSAAATLDWLDAHGRSDLVRDAVVVVSAVRRGGNVDVDRVVEHFAGRCRTVLQVPYDPHLAEGAQFNIDALRPATRHAYVELAAAVADGFTAPTPTSQGPDRPGGHA